MDMRFGTWNVRRHYTAGSLKTVARELGKYRLDRVVFWVILPCKMIVDL
jgi:hypothetical protein